MPFSNDLSIAIHSSPTIGLVAVFREGNAVSAFDAVVAENADPALLARSFRWPGSPQVNYNVHAPKNRWVIATVDGEPLDRAFDKWPLLEERSVISHRRAVRIDPPATESGL